MFVLDTNVVSELMRPAPDGHVVAWLDAQAPDALWITSVTVAELLFGIARLPDGARKQSLALAAQTMIEDDFAERIFGFDSTSATVFADIAAQRERAGRPLSMADGYIAAICLAHSAQLVTRNSKDFEGLGLALLNPWDAG
jgi:toxin FitB